jgi:uncharacterized protein YrrD
LYKNVFHNSSLACVQTQYPSLYTYLETNMYNSNQMLINFDKLVGIRIISLRNGRQIGVITKSIVDPNKLIIIGFYTDQMIAKKALVLLLSDIRELTAENCFVNDETVLSETSDLIRLQKIIEYNYSPDNKMVQLKDGKKIGKSTGAIINPKSMIIEKIYYKKGMFGVFSSELSFPRENIIDVTNIKFVIKDTTTHKIRNTDTLKRRLKPITLPGGQQPAYSVLKPDNADLIES